MRNRISTNCTEMDLPTKLSLKTLLVDQFQESACPQYITAAAVTIGGFSLGNCLGYSSPALPNIKSSGYFFVLETSQLSWIGSLVTIGALIGSIYLLFSIPFALGWLTIASALNIYMLYAGGFPTGISVGAVSLIELVYLTEISEAEIRGLLVSLFKLFKLRAYCSLFAIFIPESPRYLLTVGKTNDAVKVLSWLRSSDPLNPSKQVLDEIDQMERAIQQKQKCQIKDLFTSPVIKPLFIAFGLMFFNQFCGANALESWIFVDNAGRRILLQFSFATMAISCMTLGTFFI